MSKQAVEIDRQWQGGHWDVENPVLLAGGGFSDEQERGVVKKANSRSVFRLMLSPNALFVSNKTYKDGNLLIHDASGLKPPRFLSATAVDSTPLPKSTIRAIIRAERINDRLIFVVQGPNDHKIAAFSFELSESKTNWLALNGLLLPMKIQQRVESLIPLVWEAHLVIDEGHPRSVNDAIDMATTWFSCGSNDAFETLDEVITIKSGRASYIGKDFATAYEGVDLEGNSILKYNIAALGAEHIVAFNNNNQTEIHRLQAFAFTMCVDRYEEALNDEVRDKMRTLKDLAKRTMTCLIFASLVVLAFLWVIHIA